MATKYITAGGTAWATARNEAANDVRVMVPDRYDFVKNNIENIIIACVDYIGGMLYGADTIFAYDDSAETSQKNATAQLSACIRSVCGAYVLRNIIAINSVCSRSADREIIDIEDGDADNTTTNGTTTATQGTTTNSTPTVSDQLYRDSKVDATADTTVQSTATTRRTTSAATRIDTMRKLYDGIDTYTHGITVAIMAACFDDDYLVYDYAGVG